MKNVPRVPVFLALCVLFLSIWAPAALAHAVLARSFPVDGSRISRSPVQVRLYFTEGVRLPFSSFHMADLQGNIYRIRAEGVPGDESQVALDLPDLPTGVYIVSWHILSASDSHLTDGRILFGVNQDVTKAARTSGAPSERVSSLEAALRWVDILLAALVIGGLAVAAWALRSATGEASSQRLAIRSRVLTCVAWAAGASLASGIALFTWEVTKIRGSMPPGASLWGVGRPLLTQGRWAVLWWTRQAAMAGLLGAALTLRKRETAESAGKRERFGAAAVVWATAGVLALVLATARALGSHAASAQFSTWAVVVDTIHVLAASIWIGGLLALTIGTWPALRRSPHHDPGHAPEAWRRFGSLAVISFGVLMVTGLFEAASQVASIDGLLFTPYGKALLAKTGLALALAGLGAANAALLHPRIRANLERRIGLTAKPARAVRLPRLAVVEGAAGAIAFLMVAIMTSSSPPRGPEFLPGAAPALSSAAAQAGDLEISMSVTPNLPGTNLISAKMASTIRPAPPEVESASLTFVSPSGQESASVPMRLIEAGQFQAGGDQLDRGGPWQIRLTAVRPGLPDALARFDLVVGSGAIVRTPRVSVAPIGRALTFGAIIALLVLIVGLMLLWRGSRPSRREPVPPPAAPSVDELDDDDDDDADLWVPAGASGEAP